MKSRLLIPFLGLSCLSCQDRGSETLKLYEFFKSEFEAREKRIDATVGTVSKTLDGIAAAIKAMESKNEETQKMLVKAVGEDVARQITAAQDKMLAEMRQELKTALANVQPNQQAAASPQPSGGGGEAPPVKPQPPRSNPGAIRIEFPDR